MAILLNDLALLQIMYHITELVFVKSFKKSGIQRGLGIN